jgi:hypothetical protein
MHHLPSAISRNCKADGFFDRSNIYGCPRKSLTKSKISNRASSHQTEHEAEDLHIVETEEAGVTEAGEATVEVGAAGEDEAAHEAVEVLRSTRGDIRE